MPGENLTRIEAQERAAVVNTHSYLVELDLTTSDETFRSKTTVKFAATEGASTFIDAITSKVHSVTLNGESLDPSAVSDGVRVELANLKAEN
jgi:aminopeptidase N